ncbi:MAG: FAD:protein FMN transferase [Kiritimatiellae bacterium]|nr:FAD:protein FMN transferase [Kiritimatiellia bacterium]
MRIDRHLIKAILTLAAVIAIVAFLLRRETSSPPNPVFSGQTMGTTYSIKLANSPLSQRDLSKLRRTIELRLESINEQMSVYLPDSEISRFNRSRSTMPFAVSADFEHVARFAVGLAARTGGAFDPTVAPLVNLWGFGPEGRHAPPAPAQLEEARARVGYGHLSFIAPHQIRKDIPDLQLDLGAVAKGYGADEVKRTILAAGVTNFLVEIGGEVVAWGLNPDGRMWSIGIQTPEFDAVPGAKTVGTLHLSRMAAATSGDYQNYVRDETGRVRAHIIDPRTGRPVEHELASVTVLARDCLTADGLATAAFVLGPQLGLGVVANYSGAEALMLVRTPDGKLSERMTARFAEVTGYEKAAGDKE